jgi:astacin
LRIPVLLSIGVVLLGGVALAQEAESAVRVGGRSGPVASVPEGYMIIESDIVVPEDFFDSGGGRATYGVSLWPGGVIPYVFDPNVDFDRRTAMREAMAEWEAASGVEFVPGIGSPNHIYIQDATFNASEGVGMAGGRHDIWIYNWDHKFIMAHELGHALGYWHEQSRTDRDTACNGFPCVVINDENICQTCCSGGPCDSQFWVRSLGGEYGPYDFDSVMHYDACAFSSCGICPRSPTCTDGGRTISVPLPHLSHWKDAIGQRDHISHWDALGMSLLYHEDDWRFFDPECACQGQEVCAGDGSFKCPYTDLPTAVASTPPDGTLWVLRPGTYSAVGVYSSAMTLRAPMGAVFDD